MFQTILHTIPKENYASLLEYCEKAKKADDTFQFIVQSDRIIIESPSRDQAFRRGVLFHHRFGCFFEVLKKENPHLCSSSPTNRHEFNQQSRCCIWCGKPAVEVAK